VKGELAPGVIYSETKLASQIGISRTPMKDALVRLSQDKYIDILPSRGFQLHSMTPQDVWMTYQTRTAIEGFCALNLVASKNTARGKESMEKLADRLERMHRLIADGEAIQNLLEEDLQFHIALVASAENSELMDLFETLHHRISVIALDSFSQPGRPIAALEEHRAIYNAILTAKNQIEIAPYSAVMRHMEASRDITLKHWQGTKE